MNILIALTFFLLISHKSEANVLAKNEKEIYRLNNEVKPITYRVDLDIPDNFALSTKFTGKVEIDIAPIESTVKRTINVNINKITLKEVKVIKTETINGAEVDTPIYKEHKVKEELEMVTITLKEDLKSNIKYKIVIEYDGILHDDMYGFYRSNYIDEDGMYQWIATTQFQPTHARRAFPCFDEPNQKAVFHISIIHSNKYHAISNAEIDTIDPVGTTDRIHSIFKETPIMSTYLVAFVVSKFAKLSQTVESIQHGLYAPKEMIGSGNVYEPIKFIYVGSGHYGFSIAPKILHEMKEFTGVSYNISKINKLDQVSIPAYSGAMENWGLVTYRVNALLWNSQDSSAKDKQTVATVVAHELTHMWFGNLVTLEWWSYSWLNEGFARYFQYIAGSKVEDTWQLDDQLVVEQQQSIFIDDSTDGVQALTSECYTPAEISSKLGIITYKKGASIIRMMEHMIGYEGFIRGLKDYIFFNQFKNTSPKDLFEALAKHSSLPDTVENIMKLWTEYGGYPVVTVSIHGENGLKFEQKRFFFNSDSTSKFKWYVPISYTTSLEKNFTNTAPKLWLTPNELETFVTDITFEDSWIVVNIKETAYIRVKYDDVLYDRLEKALMEEDFDGIHVLNRAQIVDDAMNLARGGHITYTRAFGILEYLANENEYYPWFSAFNALAFLKRRTDSTSETSTYLDKHILNLMETVYKNTTFEDESHDQISILKKSLVLKWACLLGDSECITKSQSTFALLENYNSAIDPNIRGVVYCTVLRSADDRKSWDYLWNKFQYSRWAPESDTLLTALGCSKDKDILREYLKKSVNPYSGIRKQDTLYVFQAVIAGNPEGVEVGLEFLQSSFEDIRLHYGSLNALTSVITSLADRLTTKEQIDELEAFITDNKENLKDAAVVAQNAVDAARENLVWFKKHEEEILTYLKEHEKGNSGISLHSSGLLISIFVFIISLY